MPPTARLRLVFMGTAELACPSLRALAADPLAQLVGVVTRPDRRQGRALRLQPSPVKVLARQLGLPLLQPERAKDPAFLDQLAALAPDLILVAAYGQLLPPALLDLPRWGCLNLHTSLLPRHRGAAPIQWALLNDEAVTGVTIMKIDQGLDTGDILTSREIPIGASETAAELHDRLAQLGADLLLETIPLYVSGRLQPRPQPAEGVSYARKITREDGRVDWTQSARQLFNRLRAFTPWPGLFTHLPAFPRPLLLKIWEVDILAQPTGSPGSVLSATADVLVIACGQGALAVRSLQLEGARRLTTREFLAGHPLPAGTRLGTPVSSRDDPAASP